MLSVQPITGELGAEVSGIDLSQPLSDSDVKDIQDALDAHQVLFFRQQKILSVDEHVALAENFGPVELPLFRTPSSHRPEVLVLDQTSPKGQGADNFHSDNSYRAAPTKASILQAQKIPDAGGDTCFASMGAAYDALSPPMQQFLEGLTAVHSLKMMEATTLKAGGSFRQKTSEWPPYSHPVVVYHPRTKRKLLYVNKNWTSHIEGVTPEESDILMSYLLNHVKAPEFQVRIKYNVGDIAFWDNIATNHYAVPDYSTRRVMQRVAIQGPEITGTVAGRSHAAVAAAS
jgi:alpha-ketoglutarate-dependent taurine dioxygenase